MIYDFPLNEKSRTYLRLESLFSQIRDNLESDQSWAHIAFFKGLFDLQELLERGDLRADLIKDLERLGQRLSHWASLPDVDLEQIQRMQQESTQLSRSLLSSPRPGARLKEDRLLGSIRQRFSIPGGLCAFDVPQLHHWLVTPAVGRHQQMQQMDKQVVDVQIHGKRRRNIVRFPTIDDPANVEKNETGEKQYGHGRDGERQCWNLEEDVGDCRE